VVDNKKVIETEVFEAMGYEVGQAFAAYTRGILLGLSGYATAAENVTETVTNQDDCKDFEADHVIEREKTQIEDCETCWCNTCTQIEKCAHIPTDIKWGLRTPFPCHGCGDGKQFMPRPVEKAACPCSHYIAGSENNG